MNWEDLRQNQIVKLRATEGKFEVGVYNESTTRNVPDRALVLVVHVKPNYDSLLRFIGLYDGSMLVFDMFPAEVEHVPDCVNK